MTNEGCFKSKINSNSNNSNSYHDGGRGDDDDDDTDDSVLRGSIVVVAKCPIPGKSKTRLIPLLGKEGSVRLAKSMLSDVLKTIDGCKELNSVRKILLYAPGTSEGLERMETLLGEIGLDAVAATTTTATRTMTTTATTTTAVKDSDTGGNENQNDNSRWWLLPMATSSTTSDLRSHDLGTKLHDALVRVRALENDDPANTKTTTTTTTSHGVVFLGMDAPILPLDDIVGGLRRARATDTDTTTDTTTDADTSHGVAAATLCPAWDGGYAMLCVPPVADPARTFANMHWSHPLTGMSQIKALTDQGIAVGVGKVVCDVDEAYDVRQLCDLLLGMDLDLDLDLDLRSDSHSHSHSDTSAAAAAVVPPETDTKNLDLPCGWPSSSPDEARCSSSGVTRSRHPVCFFTRRTLREAGLLDKPGTEHEGNE